LQLKGNVREPNDVAWIELWTGNDDSNTHNNYIKSITCPMYVHSFPLRQSLNIDLPNHCLFFCHTTCHIAQVIRIRQSHSPIPWHVQ
jgi:hypothetical protein